MLELKVFSRQCQSLLLIDLHVPELFSKKNEAELACVARVAWQCDSVS